MVLSDVGKNTLREPPNISLGIMHSPDSSRGTEKPVRLRASPESGEGHFLNTG